MERAFAAAELGAGEAGAGAEEVEEGGARIVVAVAELEALAVDREDHRRHRAEAEAGMGSRCGYRNPIPIYPMWFVFLSTDDPSLPFRCCRGRRELAKFQTEIDRR